MLRIYKGLHVILTPVEYHGGRNYTTHAPNVDHRNTHALPRFPSHLPTLSLSGRHRMLSTQWRMSSASRPLPGHATSRHHRRHRLPSPLPSHFPTHMRRCSFTLANASDCRVLAIRSGGDPVDRVDRSPWSFLLPFADRCRREPAFGRRRYEYPPSYRRGFCPAGIAILIRYRDPCR